MQLCFGCLHSFHPSSFEDGQCTFNEEVIHRFEAVRSIATKFQPSTPSARQQVAAMEDEIKRLAKAMKVSMDDKNAEIAQLTAQVHFLGEQMEVLIRERQSAAAAALEGSSKKSPRGGTSSSSALKGFGSFTPTHDMSPRAADALGGSAFASGLLNRFMLASRKMPASPRGNGLGVGSNGAMASYGHGGLGGSGGGGGVGSGTVGSAIIVKTGGGGGGGGGRPTTSGGRSSAAASAAAMYRSNISASLFIMLEGLVVKTRADYGVLWIRAPDSDGLAATFTAGRHERRLGGGSDGIVMSAAAAAGDSNAMGTVMRGGGGKTLRPPAPPPTAVGTTPFASTAPYFIGLNSIPGSVANTGIVLNMAAEVPPIGDALGHLMHGGGGDNADEDEDGDASEPLYPPFAPATDHDLLTNVCTQHSSLTVPVFSRYGAAVRRTMAVIQLFGGSPAGTPFTVDDERLAESTSVLLSHIISTHYANMSTEWMTSTFNPAAVLSNATYYSDIDQSPQTKGADGFAPPPMIIYRGKYSGTLPPPRERGSSSSGNGNGATAFLTELGRPSVSTAPRLSNSRGGGGGASSRGGPNNANDTASSASHHHQPIKMRNLRCDMAEFGTPLEVYGGLRDLSRYLDELEELKRNNNNSTTAMNGGLFPFGNSAPTTPATGGGLPAPSGGGDRPPSSSSAAGGISALPSLMRPRVPTAARFNPTNAMVTTSNAGPPSSSSLSAGPTTVSMGRAALLGLGSSGAGSSTIAASSMTLGTGPRNKQTTLTEGAMDTLEMDTISRLDALMAAEGKKGGGGAAEGGGGGGSGRGARRSY